jgi:phage baseplate assembly protein W
LAFSPLVISEDDAAVIAVLPLKTYALNLSGTIDGRDAITQLVDKAVRTARYRFAIYDYDYGCEIEDIIGQDVSSALLESEIPRVIREALIYDERIDNVSNFEIRRDADKLYVSFFVSVDNELIPVEITI